MARGSKKQRSRPASKQMTGSLIERFTHVTCPSHPSSATAPTTPEQKRDQQQTKGPMNGSAPDAVPRGKSSIGRSAYAAGPRVEEFIAATANADSGLLPSARQSRSNRERGGTSVLWRTGLPISGAPR